MRQLYIKFTIFLLGICLSSIAQEEWLVDFSLQSNQGNVVVNWTIARGSNCYDVTVERWSAGEEKFDTLYIYSGVCSSNERDSAFSFIDTTPTSGINTYRVCFIRSSSNPLSIFVNPSEEGFALYPNPAQSSVQIVINENQSGNRLEVYDAMGRIVFEKVLTLETTEIELLSLPSGAYYFRLSDNEKDYIVKFLKIN